MKGDYLHLTNDRKESHKRNITITLGEHYTNIAISDQALRDVKTTSETNMCMSLDRDQLILIHHLISMHLGI